MKQLPALLSQTIYLVPYRWITYKETTLTVFIKKVRLLCLIFFYPVVCNVSVPGET